MDIVRGDRVTLLSTNLPSDLYGLAGTVMRAEGLTLHVKLDDPPLWCRHAVTFTARAEEVVKGVYRAIPERSFEVDPDRDSPDPDLGIPGPRKLRGHLKRKR